jgi:SHS2 domain-containing protein
VGASPRFRIVPHTADVAVCVYGDSFADLIVNSAAAFNALSIDNPRSVRPVLARRIQVEAQDLEDLLVRWLNELVFMLDAQNFAGSVFVVEEVQERKLCVEVRGEKCDSVRHRRRLEVKAATYHAVKVRQCRSRWVARVIFDV